MSLFKERQQTSKRIIALENQILALKQELANQSIPVVSHDKCDQEKLLLEEEIKSLKAENKKLKSDLTRSKNKVTKLQEELEILTAG